MDLEQPFATALGTVAMTLNQARIRYQVGGSCLLRLSGHDVAVGDLDLVLPADERVALEKACSHWELELSEGGPEPWHSSWIARWQVGAVGVEAIGGLALRIDGKVTSLPYQDTGLVANVEGQAVPLAPLAQWRQIYQVYRPEKAGLLED